MLITISGIVGSGKSTAARTVIAMLSEAGFQPRYLRFRYLRVVGFGNPRRATPAVVARESDPGSRARGRGFRLRRLTTARAVGYAARIIAFRLSGIGAASRCDIVDRYFYDNLVQYRVTTALEHFYARILRRLIPRPDLAIVLLASNQTIASRRPQYAREYVELVGQHYEALADIFPELVRVRTDPGSATEDQIRRAVHAVVRQGRRTS